MVREVSKLNSSVNSVSLTNWCSIAVYQIFLRNSPLLINLYFFASYTISISIFYKFMRGQAYVVSQLLEMFP